MEFLYVLDGHNPMVEPNHLKWAQWFETADRVVNKTQVGGDVEVSTVFLAIDHNHGLQGPPILFETMVFGGELDGECNRYTTWERAVEGHQQIVKLVQLAEGEL